MNPIGAFIAGCLGTALTPSERDFFGRTNPFGLILFKRNCETPEQLKRLTDDFRAAVGRRNAPVLIDQEGGRVQRLGPPSNSWRRYPPARAYGEAYARDPLAALRSARNIGRLMAEDLIASGLDAASVRRVVRLIDGSEYKRRQAAPGLKVTSRAFGVGRRMPIAQRWRG